jgi:MFS family permease
VEIKKYQQNIGKLFIITICQGLVFAYVIERIFAQERGLTILEMQYLLIYYSIISVVLEIPAGVMADLWKKKYTLALGMFICIFEFVACIFAYNVYEFSLAYLAAAVGGSLKSGTIDSILYQTLKDIRREKEYVKIKGRLKFTKYGVSGLAAVTGGYIAQFHSYEMTYWLSLVSFPIGIYLAMTLFEKKVKGEKSSSVSYKSFFLHLKNGFYTLGANSNLRKLIVISGLIGAVLYGELHEMSMLVYPELSIDIKYFGYVSLAITIVGAMSGLVSGKLESKMKNNFVYILPFLIASATIFLFGTLPFWWTIIFLIAAIGILETLTPIFSGLIQENSPDELRVTISSMEAFMYNALCIIVGVVFGYIAELFSIQTGFQSVAILLLIAVFIKPTFISSNKFLAEVS